MPNNEPIRDCPKCGSADVDRWERTSAFEIMCAACGHRTGELRGPGGIALGAFNTPCVAPYGTPPVSPCPLPWEALRTEETRAAEAALRAAGFARVDCYQVTRFIVRLRVIDRRFVGRTAVERYDMVSPHVDALPGEIAEDINMTLLIAPAELGLSGDRIKRAANAFFEVNPAGD
jgi:hypothetical protein